MPVGVPRAGDTKFEVLSAVSDHWKSSRKGPTVAEIRDTVGLNARSSIQFHINDLIEQFDNNAQKVCELISHTFFISHIARHSPHSN